MPTDQIVTEKLVALGLTIMTASTAERPNLAVAHVRTMAESAAMTCRADEDAYARLFAAAPDLLDALRGVVAIVDSADLLNLSTGVQLGATSWYCKAVDRFAVARAAVAKADGAK